MGLADLSTFPIPKISLGGRVVIMTGGDRVLGFSMATALMRCGARLVIASNDSDACTQASRELDKLAGAQCSLAVTTDILCLDQCRHAVQRAVEVFGQCDVLFNNARRFMRGPGLPPQGNSLPFYETNPDIYKQTVQVNVIGTFFMARAAVEHFRTKGSGKISMFQRQGEIFQGHETPRMVLPRRQLNQRL